MAAQCDPLSGYLPQSDHGSNSERRRDSPLPGSEEDLSGPQPPPDPEWTEERFRVDRKKLEIMLLGGSDEGRRRRCPKLLLETASSGISGRVYSQIMDETQTQIAWPSKLKIGAKSKKDPHIKVCGRRENVREAKDRIMSVLDTKSNRVTLKMDVSHTEHSHVIGKGGNNIKGVMEETGCHIHFPDSNRNNQAEKSNQVSIAGQPGGVEAARVKIRELLPLVLSFELPAILQTDTGSPTVQHIAQTYKLAVSFKPPTRLYRGSGVVHGSQNDTSAVKEEILVFFTFQHSPELLSEEKVPHQLQCHRGRRVRGALLPALNGPLLPETGSLEKRASAVGGQPLTRLSRWFVQRGTALLLEHLTGSLASSISVSTHLDIAPRHHLFMKGHNSSNIKHITQRTGAQIHFPDPNSLQSAVYIQGSIESVCLARQYLMGCLPLVLMFDIKEDVDVEPQYITALMEQLDVFISIKPKPKQPSKSVIVKSVERNAVNMYEARKFLLGLESNGVSLSSAPAVLSPAPNGPSPSLICPVGLDILASAGLGLSSLGFLGAAASPGLNSAPNAVLNSLNSAMSPLHTPSPSNPTAPASLWPSSLAGAQGRTRTTFLPSCCNRLPESKRLWTSAALRRNSSVCVSVFPGFSSQLVLHPAAQATLSSILLPGVQGYTQSTPSPPPGLAPIDEQPSGVPDCSSSCALNGHVKVTEAPPRSLPSAAGSLADSVLTPAPCDPVQEASGHSPSEPLSSKSDPDEGTDRSRRCTARPENMCANPVQLSLSRVSVFFRCFPPPTWCIRTGSSSSAPEPVCTGSQSDPAGGSDTFVEVGMPRSPSHSANGSELKQMLASCKTSSGKRQAVELLQGTKNSHLHSDCLLSDAESSSSDSPVADKRAPGSERAAERAAQQSERERIRLAPQTTFTNIQVGSGPPRPRLAEAQRSRCPLSFQAFDYEQKKLLATKGEERRSKRGMQLVVWSSSSMLAAEGGSGCANATSANAAMLKKPVVTEVRTPTNTWSGLGFSKSMPAETIKELRRANHVSYKPSMSTTYEVPNEAALSARAPVCARSRGSDLLLSPSSQGSPLSLSRSSSREGIGNGSDSVNWRERNGAGNALEFPSTVSSPKRKQNKSAAEHYLSSSNYMDCISSLSGSNGCSLQASLKGSDLPELFSNLGLGKYTDVFQQQEIDLQTFLTLTDQDLKELGITTFGARRKMLLAISGRPELLRDGQGCPAWRRSFTPLFRPLLWIQHMFQQIPDRHRLCSQTLDLTLSAPSQSSTRTGGSCSSRPSAPPSWKGGRAVASLASSTQTWRASAGDGRRRPRACARRPAIPPPLRPPVPSSVQHGSSRQVWVLFTARAGAGLLKLRRVKAIGFAEVPTRSGSRSRS
ncbi:unnamed protein product [Tetraodon nigroviridis]|uniref:(spotted green pufferfish) hypothetical protein n=1 Tax=Tetraodon nigroviridis TaxID=99883 RepID=Q4RNF4_TETNG|nr:unnamed protein product [Tetraodon nigroviridis]